MSEEEARKPPAKKRARKRMVTRADVDRLSGQLEDMLLLSQKRAPPPAGMIKCPAGCGADILPTKNGRVRVHDAPLSRERCQGSGKPVSSFSE